MMDASTVISPSKRPREGIGVLLQKEGKSHDISDHELQATVPKLVEEREYLIRCPPTGASYVVAAHSTRYLSHDGHRFSCFNTLTPGQNVTPVAKAKASTLPDWFFLWYSAKQTDVHYTHHNAENASMMLQTPSEDEAVQKQWTDLGWTWKPAMFTQVLPSASVLEETKHFSQNVSQLIVAKVERTEAELQTADLSLEKKLYEHWNTKQNVWEMYAVLWPEKNAVFETIEYSSVTCKGFDQNRCTTPGLERVDDEEKYCSKQVGDPDTGKGVTVFETCTEASCCVV
ncbi:unnamed protein product, partial [Amoebophrya sp. A25]|eukprot:GSA25T00017184001.1